MSMLSKFLWGSKHQNNPANAAMPYINQGIQTRQPYVNQGQQAMGELTPQYSQMAQDPNAYYNNIAGGYQKSAGFDAKRDELLRQAHNTAAAGGFVGGEQHQKGATGIVDSLMNEDFQNWYNNVMGINKAGQAGQQHLGDQGFDSATNQTNLQGQQGQLAYQGQAWKNQQKQDKINQLMKLIGTGGAAAAGFMMPGGNALTAMQGAQAGSQLF